MADVLGEFRYAARTLRTNPGFALVAILTLALGIGANTAILTVVNAAFFARYPLENPDRLVRLYGEDLPRNTRQLGFSLPKFEFFRRQQTSFSDLAAVNFNGFTLVRGADAEQVAGGAITSNFLAAFGVHPIAGRFFHVHEEAGVRLAVLGEEFWRERFAADPAVVGQTLTLSGQLYTIVGVAPQLPAFWDAQVWLTEPFEVPGFSRDLLQRGVTFLAVIGRIAPGVSHDQATREVELLATRYRESHTANADSAWTATTLGLRDDIVGASRSSLMVLLAAVGLLLVVACANVANLLIVRVTGRRQEIAMRTALGASRARIARQLVIESVTLSAFAAVLGAALARLAMPGLLALAANNLAFAADIQLNLAVLAATVCLSTIAGVALGAYPAFHGSRSDVMAALRDGGRALSGSVGSHAARQTFVGAQVALSLVLLIGASLLVSSFLRLRQQPPGFDAPGVFVAAVNLPPARYPNAQAQQRFYERLADALATTPGVTRATLAQMVPLNGPFTRAPFAVDEGAVPPLNERPLGLTESVLPGYFATLGIPLRAGRDFNERDTDASPLVAIVSESTARRLFRDGNALGRRLVMGSQGGGQSMEIVGVVGDVRSQTLRQIAEVEFYRPVTQRPRTFMQMVVRTTGDPAAFEATARRAVAALDPVLPLVGVNTLSGILDRSLAQERLLFTLVGVFAAFALTLSAVGIYGVVSYVVRARTAEIGVRMALGAGASGVLGLVLAATLRPVVAGLVIGLGAAALLGRSMQALLFDVSPLDPAMLTAAALALAVVACAACAVPAWRAARISPLAAMRQR